MYQSSPFHAQELKPSDYCEMWQDSLEPPKTRASCAMYLFADLDVGELALLLAVLASRAVGISVARATALLYRGSGGDAHHKRRNGNERLGNEHRI